MTLLLPLLAFLFVSLLVAGAAMLLSPSGGGVIERRLGELRAIRGLPVAEPSPYSETVVKGLKKLGTYAPTPAGEVGKLKSRLLAAGFRGGLAQGQFSCGNGHSGDIAGRPSYGGGSVSQGRTDGFVSASRRI